MAQESFSISGSVIDEKNKAFDLAFVSLSNALDSTVVKSDYTDLDGSFKLNNVPSGNYFLQVSMLSFNTYTSELELNENLSLEPIVLSASTMDLDVATVETKVPFVERKIDRIVVNPEALGSTAGNNAIDIIEKAPGLSLNPDGTIQLKGRSGVAVYINDKPSYLSGTELESYLRSLPAGSIKKIEIMENPPAKYDAAGSAGIINIILDRNTLRGFYGNLSISARQGKMSSSNNSLNLNYNRKKISIYTNIYPGFWGTYQDLNINRFYQNSNNVIESSFAQNSYIEKTGMYLNGKVGMDFYPTEKATLGISFKNNGSPSENDTQNTAFVRDSSNAIIQRVVADNFQDDSFKNQTFSAYYTQQLDSLGQNFSIDADLVTYDSGSKQLFKNFIYNNNNVLTYSDQINGDLPSEINIYAAKADYYKPLPKGKFEAGAKVAFTETDNEAIYTSTVEGVTFPNYGLSNQFLYEEWINAAYVNFATSLGKVDLQAGLRGEATSLKGNQLGNVEQTDSSFTRSYESLFPTFYASWRMDSLSNNVLSLSYSRRINRPYFMDLNPFISPLDRFTFYTGNPNLLPTFSNNISITHTWKNIINATFSYSKTTDGINETLEIQDEIYYSRPGNIADSESYNFSLDGSIPVTKWYTVNFYASYGYQTFTGPLYDQNLASSGDYHFLNINNSFVLGKGWQANLSGNYRSDMVYSQLLLEGFGTLGLGIQKGLWDGKGNLRLSIEDALFTSIGAGVINNLDQTEANWNSVRDTRRASIAFSYNFGRGRQGKGRRNTSGSDDEQQRVRG